MMRGLSAKRALFPLRNLEMTFILDQIKEIYLIYLIMVFIMGKNVRVENGVYKFLFLSFTFIVHVSTNFAWSIIFMLLTFMSREQCFRFLI